jgi:hypothetical protein
MTAFFLQPLIVPLQEPALYFSSENMHYMPYVDASYILFAYQVSYMVEYSRFIKLGQQLWRYSSRRDN